MKKSFYYFFFSLCFPLSIYSQSVVLGSGGNVSGTSGSASYSVGQVVYSFNSASSGSETQGVQQSYTINDVGVENNTAISVGVYPNPTSNTLQVDFGYEKFYGCHYTITDVNGKIIVKADISAPNFSIDMRNYASATYFLNLYDETNELVNIFKILKH